MSSPTTSAYERLKEHADRASLVAELKEANRKANSQITTQQEKDLVVVIGRAIIMGLLAPNAQEAQKFWQIKTRLQWIRAQVQGGGTWGAKDQEWLDMLSDADWREEWEEWHKKLQRIVHKISKAERKGKSKETK